ncbi:MAG: hypothetical protein SH856_02015 [Flavobacteriales bacterium]|nr:hypothetical protein [Flavobacteriales bacterium]
MSGYILTLKDEKKKKLFLDLMSHLDFVKVVSEIKMNQPLIRDLTDSLNAVDLHRQGKVKLKSAEDLLNEL